MVQHALFEKKKYTERCPPPSMNVSGPLFLQLGLQIKTVRIVIASLVATIEDNKIGQLKGSGGIGPGFTQHNAFSKVPF